MQVVWGIVQKFYTATTFTWYVARIVYVDGRWFEFYSHADSRLNGKRFRLIKSRAQELGLDLHPGVFHDSPTSLVATELICTRD